jgi:hypothetical protein
MRAWLARQEACATITSYQIIRITRQSHGQQKGVIRIIGFNLTQR